MNTYSSNASDIGAVPALSIIVPTYREAENLPHLIEAIGEVIAEMKILCEVLIMDDASDDGTPEVVASLGKPWVRLITRSGERGLSIAVLEGLREARAQRFVVMDADLSHPPAQIPALVDALDHGHDFALGSRYVDGATTDETWTLFRKLNSWVATVLARPFTTVRDPMSGFFALDRATFARADYLNPVGYKIGLELVVKCRCENVAEIPIHFANRYRGKSKLTLKEQFKYVQHLRRLMLYKYPERAHLLQFLAVGASGVVVNLSLLTALMAIHVRIEAAVATAIAVSMFTNFALNRRFTFSYALGGPWVRQLAGYVGASSLGALVNYGVTLAILGMWQTIPFAQAAALGGIAAGTGINFVINRFFVFKKDHGASGDRST